MMLYTLGVSAACYLILTITGVLRDMPDAERAASLYISVAALAGVVAWAAERTARSEEHRKPMAENTESA